MQAQCHGGHFKAVTPKWELCTPKRAKIVRQRKATGPTPLGCICDQDLFVLFLVFTPKCEGKICTKGGFRAPKRECVPPKESNRTDTIGVHLWSRPFYVVFSLHPQMWGQKPYRKRFLCPQARMSPQAKIVPQKKTTRPMPLGCIFEEGFCSFFVFFLECEGKIRVKGGFYAPKPKIVPKKKATGPTPLRCICDKDLFFLVFIPEYIFCPNKIFYASLPSTLLWRRVCIHE